MRTSLVKKVCRSTTNSAFVVKPWPNGVASRRKLKTWVYLWLRLARTCVHLRWLAMTCAHFGRDQICTQVKASFSPLATQAKSAQVKWRPLAYHQPMKYRKCLPWNGFICGLRVLVRKLASPLGHSAQVSTQVQLATTCDYLLVRLARALSIPAWQTNEIEPRERDFPHSDRAKKSGESNLGRAKDGARANFSWPEFVQFV